MKGLRVSLPILCICLVCIVVFLYTHSRLDDDSVRPTKMMSERVVPGINYTKGKTVHHHHHHRHRCCRKCRRHRRCNILIIVIVIVTEGKNVHHHHRHRRNCCCHHHCIIFIIVTGVIIVIDAVIVILLIKEIFNETYEKVYLPDLQRKAVMSFIN